MPKILTQLAADKTDSTAALQLNQVLGLKQKIEKFNLTSRETEVALLWIQDFDYRTISKQLLISEHTTRATIKNIYFRTKVNSKASLLLKIFFSVDAT
ncbi:helix-turn-helix transcriptional regulator [Paenibacillus agaridevorans]|uniref:helix-turn-helix transcriptional regulator n=1 Tax=Paenibacillus agaridevorans TaxID=171404 RepID=UPI001BE4AE8D|nr:LuxR C-terminal-related transcriptional regulator [Paenibacillus agaridevorans]